MRECPQCGVEKPLTAEFWYRDSSSAIGFDYWCKVCSKAKVKRYQKTDKAKQKTAAYNQSDDRKKARVKYMRSEKGRNTYNKHTSKYRANKKNAPVVEDFSPQDVLDKWGTDCHICSEPIDLFDWHMDHVIPLSSGVGPHTLANVKPSHPTCNISKGAK